ncbi:hypothetical protein HOLleu_18309 [Holothuria leucospilota]|uniref:Uncharacterized protein n=1 Tax=Holothuria leucospilota TaxID=206669 RepID=A0A9Q1H907_HOLLE|nr:hypothetical protein HOLleu_18309 [Holothuria leucospilota]
MLPTTTVSQPSWKSFILNLLTVYIYVYTVLFVYLYENGDTTEENQADLATPTSPEAWCDFGCPNKGSAAETECEKAESMVSEAVDTAADPVWSIRHSDGSRVWWGLREVFTYGTADV